MSSLNISLIYPPVLIKERYGVDIGDIGGRQAPLGILYLSSFLKHAGYTVQVIDAEAEQLDNSTILKRLTNFSPDCIGISITTVAFNNSVALSKEIRKQLSVGPIIIGGPHVTANPIESLEPNCFDIGVCGEGELTLLELLENLDNPLEYAKIKGLVYRDSNNRIIVNEKREHIKSLDSLPYPDRDALADVRFYRPPIGCYRKSFVVSLITSRGCPYRCIFCDNNTFGRKVRYFSPEYVVDEIESVLRKYNAEELTFVDDTFPSNRVRFKKIMALIGERKLKFSWTCMANVNDLDEELLMLMRKAGCWQIAIGIESGDNDVLKFIKKGVTTDKIRDVVVKADKSGIMIKGFFMLGHPTETKSSIEKTQNFALSLPLTDVTCTISTPIKGTELYEITESQQYGSFNPSADPSQFSYWKPVFIPTGLTETELYEAQYDFFKNFYLRPKIIIRQLLKIRNFIILKRYLRTLFNILKIRYKGGFNFTGDGYQKPIKRNDIRRALKYCGYVMKYLIRLPQFYFMPSEQIFGEIYRKNIWNESGSVSGDSSTISYTKRIREELPILIRRIGVTSFLDIPCGDFNWMKEVQLDVDTYIGADIVEDLILVNSRKFTNKIRRFIKLDITKDRLPEVDMIFCKDCLVHLSFDEIFLAIKNFKRSKSKYLLTTTFTKPRKNRDMITGGWRPLNLQQAPFNFPKPIDMINEDCRLRLGRYSDKSLGLWRISDITL